MLRQDYNHPTPLIPPHPATQGSLADHATLARIGRELLVALGLDPTHPAIVETPQRFARLWHDFMSPSLDGLVTTFTSDAIDQMVVVRDIRVWSMCEHHLLPFWCDVTIGVITTNTILGLSKFARIATACAHQPQTQERLVQSIATAMQQAAETPHVAVLANGEHLCMAMRGARSDAQMATSVTHGLFREDARARQEFLHLAQRTP